MAWCLGACTPRWRANLCINDDGIILAGHIYFDTFPRSEDPVRECELNIRTVKRFYKDRG